MASIVDSIKSIYADNYSLLRLGIFSYMIYLMFNLISRPDIFNPSNILMWLIIVYMYLGFCCIIMNNRIKQNIESLPKLDPLYFITVASKAMAIFLPFAIVGFFLVNLVVGLFNFEGLPQQVAIWLIRFLALTVNVTALINFAEKYDIKQGFNVTKILSGIADVLVFTTLCLLFIAIYSLFVAAPVLYLIYNFFKIGPAFIYTATFFITLNLAFAADYWGQLHFDIESKNNYY